MAILVQMLSLRKNAKTESDFSTNYFIPAWNSMIKTLFNLLQHDDDTVIVMATAALHSDDDTPIVLIF